MTRRATILGMLVAGSTLWSCKSSKISHAEVADVNLGVLRSNEMADLGQVSYDAFAGRTIEVQNVSDAPIEIGLAAKSCGCVDVELPDGPVASGASGKIRFGMVVAGGSEPVRHGIALRVCKVSEPNNVQIVQAGFMYVPDIEFEVQPTQVSLDVTAGEEFQTAIYLHPRVYKSLQLNDVRVECVEMHVVSKEMLDESGTIKVTVAGSFPTAQLERTFVELQTNNQRFPTVRIPFHVHVHDRLVAQPTPIVFPWPDELELTRTVQLTGTLPSGPIHVISELPPAFTLNVLQDDDSLRLEKHLETTALSEPIGRQVISLHDGEIELCAMTVAWAINRRHTLAN